MWAEECQRRGERRRVVGWRGGPARGAHAQLDEVRVVLVAREQHPVHVRVRVLRPLVCQRRRPEVGVWQRVGVAAEQVVLRGGAASGVKQRCEERREEKVRAEA